MRRTLAALTTFVAFALLAPVAFAQQSGTGAIGKADDKLVTNAGFIVIAAIPLFVLLMSLLQWKLDSRKEARKKAAKVRADNPVWKGGW